MKYRTRTPTGDREIEVILPSIPYRAFVSGGFDSAVMLYMLCKEAIAEKQDTVYAVVVDRGPELGAVEFSKQVCQWATEKTGIKVDLLVVEAPDGIHHSEYVKKPGYKLIEQGYVLISADTQNPPDVTLPGLAPVRIPPNFEHDWWQHPFSAVDKSHTVFLAKYFRILDDISRITHTCTASPDVRCGECWQDHERAWAFKVLGYEDPGQY